MDQEEKGLSTFLNHHPRVKVHAENVPTIAPIYQSAKFAMSPSMPYSDQFIYTRVSNPNLRELELTLSTLR